MAAQHHAVDDRAAGVVDAAEVDLQHVLPVLVLHQQQRGVAEDRRRGDQRGDRAERVLGAVHEVADGLRVRDIGPADVGGPAEVQ